MTKPYVSFNRADPYSLLHVVSALLLSPRAVQADLGDHTAEKLSSELEYLCEEYTTPGDEVGMVDGVWTAGVPVELEPTKELLSELCELVKMVAESRLPHKGDTSTVCQLSAILNNLEGVQMAINGLDDDDLVPDKHVEPGQRYLGIR